MKRSQATVFIIMGILLLVVVSFIIMISGIDFPRLLSGSEAKAFDIYLKDCLEQSFDHGIYMLGMHSGNIDSPTRYLVYNSSREEHDLEKSRQQLKEFMRLASQQCIDLYPNKDALNITKKQPEIEVFFDDAKTRVTIDGLYTYKKDSTTHNSRQLEIITGVRYKLMYTTVDNLITEREREGYIFDSSALKQPGMDISVAELS